MVENKVTMVVLILIRSVLVINDKFCLFEASREGKKSNEKDQ